MLTASVVRWAAWAPGLSNHDDWAQWFRNPRCVDADGSPAVAFLPPLLRRRCSRLTRMVLQAAFGCGTPSELATVATVFASRHGDTTTNIALLESLARCQPLSPTLFAHSVHNAPSGVFAIVTRNRFSSSSVAAGQATFPHGFLEASLMLRRSGSPRVLLVTADEPVPRPFEAFVDEPRAAYAVALLLEPGEQLAFRPSVDGEKVRAVSWPAALEFLRWLCSGDPAVTLGGAGNFWTWTRRSTP